MKKLILDQAINAANLIADKSDQRVIAFPKEAGAILFTDKGMAYVKPTAETKKSEDALFYMHRARMTLTDEEIMEYAEERLVDKIELPESKYHFRYIALCGFPKTGKSTIQQILKEEFNIVPVDDGRILRDAARTIFGLTIDHVTTQHGKSSIVKVCEKDWEVRKLLGVTGNLLEQTFGDQIVPEAAVRDAENLADGRDMTFSFGSVRKNQGITYRKDTKGVIVEIVRPGIEWSGNDFDLYDKSLVDCTFVNDTENLDELRERVIIGFGKILGDERGYPDSPVESEGSA